MLTLEMKALALQDCSVKKCQYWYQSSLNISKTRKRLHVTDSKQAGGHKGTKLPLTSGKPISAFYTFDHEQKTRLLTSESLLLLLVWVGFVWRVFFFFFLFLSHLFSLLYFLKSTVFSKKILAQLLATTYTSLFTGLKQT